MHRIREYNSDSGTIVAKQYTIQFSAFGEPGTAKNQVGDELPVNRPKRPIISARCIVWTTAVCTWSLTQPGMPFGILVSHFMRVSWVRPHCGSVEFRRFCRYGAIPVINGILRRQRFPVSSICFGLLLCSLLARFCFLRYVTRR